ncbi:MAG: glycosyltransferase, partial [Bacteroidaceae bacterium]|nr:glycosyltransferase [Bacteroidaceae bacterium]
MPLFSIITVTYNAAGSLRRTLSSVSSQTFRDVEHIFIDGVSTDGTLNILSDYRSRYGSDYAISVFSEPDNGLYDAMNKGLRRASGQYLVFLNAGDSLADNHTLAHLATLAGGQPAVIYGDTLWTDEEGIVIGSRNHSAPKRLDWKSFRYGMLVCHQAFYARREIAQNVQYDTSYRFSADVDWCIRVMKEA